METETTFARVGGPPADWQNLVIIDLDSGRLVNRVVEVNTVEGWLLKHAEDENGRPYVCDHEPPCPDCKYGGTEPDEHVRTERLTGNFRIDRNAA